MSPYSVQYPTAISDLFPVLSTREPNLFEAPSAGCRECAPADFLRSHPKASPANVLCKRLPIAVERVGNGKHQKLDAKILRTELRASVTASLGRIWPRHADAGDIFRAQRIGGDGGHERGIDAAAQPDHHFAKSAFAHVIARADHQRAISRFELIGNLRTDVAGAGWRYRKTPDLLRTISPARPRGRPAETQRLSRRRSDCRFRPLDSHTPPAPDGAWPWPAACRGGCARLSIVYGEEEIFRTMCFPSRPVP